MRLLRKTATPKKYERRFYQHKNRKKANKYNKHHIRIACGSQELVIYDKIYQLTENDLEIAYESLPTGVLRIEVHYSRSKLNKIEKELQSGDTLDILWQLMQQSKARILHLVEKCYPNVPYYSMEDLVERINNSPFQRKTKERMLTLVQLMQRKQSIDAAFHQMQKTDDLLRKFEKLGANPIPLRVGFAAKRIPGLPELLEAVDVRPVNIELTYWKWK